MFRRWNYVSYVSPIKGHSTGSISYPPTIISMSLTVYLFIMLFSICYHSSIPLIYISVPFVLYIYFICHLVSFNWVEIEKIESVLTHFKIQARSISILYDIYPPLSVHIFKFCWKFDCALSQLINCNLFRILGELNNSNIIYVR